MDGRERYRTAEGPSKIERFLLGGFAVNLRVFFGAVGFTMALALGHADAIASTLTVVNNTREVITQLFVRPPGTNSWGKNVLAGKHLAPGATWNAQIRAQLYSFELVAPGYPMATGTTASDVCPWRIHAVFAGGASTDISNINFCAAHPTVRMLP